MKCKSAWVTNKWNIISKCKSELNHEKELEKEIEHFRNFFPYFNQNFHPFFRFLHVNIALDSAWMIISSVKGLNSECYHQVLRYKNIDKITILLSWKNIDHLSIATFHESSSCNHQFLTSIIFLIQSFERVCFWQNCSTLELNFLSVLMRKSHHEVSSRMRMSFHEMLLLLKIPRQNKKSKD